MYISEQKRTLAFGIAMAFFLAIVTPLLLTGRAGAATIDGALVRFDSMQASAATTGTVCATPTSTATEASVQVTFPTGYTTSTTVGDWTVDTSNLAWPASASAWPGIATATSAVGAFGGTVTFPSNDLTAGTLYCFNWTSTAALSVTATPGNSLTGTVVTRTSVPADIDTGYYATAAVSSDQITVTAEVARTFSFALSGTTDALTPSLTTAAVSSSTTARTATVNTNAQNGWYVWAKDLNTGLKSASAGNYTIASTTPGTNSTLAAGTEGYNTGVTSSQTSGTGTITVAAPFVGGSTGKGGGLDTTLRTLASSNGSANTAVLTLTNNAAVSSITPAATDYTDTITVVAAGLF